MRCSHCGSNGHTLALCSRTFLGSAARARLRCSYCGSNEHDVIACPKTYAGSAARAWYPHRIADHFKKD